MAGHDAMTASASRYDYRFDPLGESTAARVCRLVGHDRSVLELGCAAGAMSAVLSRHYGCQVTGVEREAPAADEARQYCERVIVASLDEPGWSAALGPSRYERVVAADVLEHLRDPLACLRELRSLLADDGELVVSVPNIAHSGVLAALLANDFPYGETGLLDRTHIHFFTSRTLGEMLVEAGFEVDTLESVDTGPWHPEFSRYWDRLPSSVRDWLARNPVGRPYQIVMRARPLAAPAPFDDGMQASVREWLAAQPADSQAAAQLEALRAEHERVLGDAAAAVAQRDLAQAQLAAMTATRSWRWMAPLRRIARTLKSRP